MKQQIHIVLGPLAGILCGTLLHFYSDATLNTLLMLALAIWVAWWWLTEAIPVAVTSLLPLLMLPLLGLAPAKDVARQYMDNIIFLFIGGFILAFAMEKWNLHKRIAYIILSATGTKPSSILLGVMTSSFLISMWISNTATVMMLLAAVLSLVTEMGQHMTEERQKRKLAAGLLIGLAYAASIGGMATLVGTPTNMIFYREYITSYPDAHDMDFFQWAKIGIPVSLFMITCAYFTLRFMFFRNTGAEVVSRDYFRNKLKALGAWTYEEKIVAGIFFATAMLWFTRSDIDLGYFTIHGWGGLFGDHAKYIEDSTVAVAAAILLFLVPSSQPGQRIMQWRDAERLPFEIILLFGGGFALAYGFEISGLSAWVGELLSGLQDVHPVVVVASIAILICVVSEFASNVASIQLMIPILIATFASSTMHPLFYLVPAALAASLGFMLPIATPPNTIVYGTKLIRTKELARAGLVVNISGIIAITLVAGLLYALGYYTL